jgi:hypothetical protein
MSETISSWFQGLADTIQHNRFLENQMTTGYYGVPVATFGLVTICAAIFVHVTFQDELRDMGTRIYDATQQGVAKASAWAETAQENVAEQASRMGEAISDSFAASDEKKEEKEEEEAKKKEEEEEREAKERQEKEEEEEQDRRGGASRRKRKSVKKR